jgi:PAS domain-containing protein
VLKISGQERRMNPSDLIVSKTTRQGRITYANDVFLSIADFTLRDVLGEPHSVVRNAAMPRAIFKLLWARLEAGREVFAYICNRTKGGDHYWVFAHVTPSRNPAGETIGYHSNRRRPNPAALAKIQTLYATLLAEEGRHANRKEGLAASYRMLEAFLADKGMDYDEYVLTL